MTHPESKTCRRQFWVLTLVSRCTTTANSGSAGRVLDGLFVAGRALRPYAGSFVAAAETATTETASELLGHLYQLVPTEFAVFVFVKLECARHELIRIRWTETTETARTSPRSAETTATESTWAAGAARATETATADAEFGTELLLG
jgi:hypothetical protein